MFALRNAKRAHNDGASGRQIMRLERPPTIWQRRSRQRRKQSIKKTHTQKEDTNKQTIINARAENVLAEMLFGVDRRLAARRIRVVAARLLERLFHALRAKTVVSSIAADD